MNKLLNCDVLKVITVQMTLISVEMKVITFLMKVIWRVLKVITLQMKVIWDEIKVITNQMEVIWREIKVHTTQKIVKCKLLTKVRICRNSLFKAILFIRHNKSNVFIFFEDLFLFEKIFWVIEKVYYCVYKDMQFKIFFIILAVVVFFD